MLAMQMNRDNSILRLRNRIKTQVGNAMNPPHLSASIASSKNEEKLYLL